MLIRGESMEWKGLLVTSGRGSERVVRLIDRLHRGRGPVLSYIRANKGENGQKV